MNIAHLSAVEARQHLVDGSLSAEDLTCACLERIETLEPSLQAWVFHDPELALAQARLADQRRRGGEPCGPLHGVPIALKDVFDTQDMPTENGTVLHRGRHPEHDATTVARLRQAGAIILGKTVTAELASFHPGPTRNPHNLAHTPGGSSSGSAAAVAAHMCPLALGTQTNGSTIRPAAYCGIYGYKPSFGLISRHGVLLQSRVLDQVGVFARSLDDVALLAEVLAGFDPLDPDTRLQTRPSLSTLLAEAPPTPPRLGLLWGPNREQADDEVQAGLQRLAEGFGAQIETIPVPAMMGELIDAHRQIMEADQALYYGPLFRQGREQLSPTLQQMIQRGQEVSAVSYHQALALRDAVLEILRPIFARVDAILTPAVTGPAPQGIEATGNPIFCTPWTLLGVPALSLPLLQSQSGLPIGVQLVAGPCDDARLLRTARWVVEHAHT